MILTTSSDIIDFNFENINDEIKSVLPENFWDIENNIVKINDEYYYCKQVSSKEMLNELIGSFYSRLIGLDAVQYKIGMFNGKMYALSKLFFKKGYSYVYPAGYFEKSLSLRTAEAERRKDFQVFFETKLLDRFNDQAVQSIFQLSAVDLKMGQADRHGRNIVFRVRNGFLEIEKIFDFSWAYEIFPDNEYSPIFYDNPFISVRKNAISLSQMACRYPEFQKAAAILSEVSVCDVLYEIETLHKIKLSDATYKHYDQVDKKNTKLLMMKL